MSLMRLKVSSALLAAFLIAGSLPVFGQSPVGIVGQAQFQASQAAIQSGTAENAKTRAASVAQAARAFEPVKIPVGNKDWTSLGLSLKKAVREGDHLVQTLKDGSKVTFTVDPDVQASLEKMLDDYNVPHSGVVLIEPSTGKVKAFVSHTEGKPVVEDLARKSLAPSASVFKIITAAALLETVGIDPEKDTCYHGGKSGLSQQNIKGDPKRDHKCATLGAALTWSINSIIAKLTYKHLKKQDLEVWAERFGYNSEIPFEFPVEVSTAEFVDDPFERARSAAGFYHTYLSPLHGALIGATLANDGVMMQPSIVEKLENASGETVIKFTPHVFKRVMKKETARKLSEMMKQTTTVGTARKYFRQRNAFPRDIVVAGKTGTLSNYNPYLGFTWFVGFADRDGQKIAVSGLVCNTPTWRIKGPFAASEAVRQYFSSRPAESDEKVAALVP